jgi:hypothetical protein
MSGRWDGATVPVAAAMVLGCDADRRAALELCAVVVGERVELDLAAVAARVGEPAAVALASYWTDARRFWARRARGRVEPGVVVRRTLGVYTQDTGKPRRDLGECYRELCALGAGAREAVDDVLDAHLGDRGEVTVESRQRDYPTCLGGVAGGGELRRTFTVTARYAAWRDRRVRRFEALKVAVDELWPVPAGDVDGLWREVGAC